jgi:hypothetical protein
MKILSKITPLCIGFGAMIAAIALISPKAMAYNESHSAGVVARITFVQPISTTKISDIVISGVDFEENSKVSLSADGRVAVAGSSGRISNQSQTGVLNIGDTRNSVINLVTTAYNLGTGVSAMKASYKVAGQANSAAEQPLVGKAAQTVYIGMDMVVEDALVASSSRGADSAKSSFDVSIVYQ